MSTNMTFGTRLILFGSFWFTFIPFRINISPYRVRMPLRLRRNHSRYGTGRTHFPRDSNLLVCRILQCPQHRLLVIARLDPPRLRSIRQLHLRAVFQLLFPGSDPASFVVSYNTKVNTKLISILFDENSCRKYFLGPLNLVGYGSESIKKPSFLAVMKAPSSKALRDLVTIP